MIEKNEPVQPVKSIFVSQRPVSDVLDWFIDQGYDVCYPARLSNEIEALCTKNNSIEIVFSSHAPEFVMVNIDIREEECIPLFLLAFDNSVVGKKGFAGSDTMFSLL